MARFSTKTPLSSMQSIPVEPTRVLANTAVQLTVGIRRLATLALANAAMRLGVACTIACALLALGHHTPARHSNETTWHGFWRWLKPAKTLPDSHSKETGPGTDFFAGLSTAGRRCHCREKAVRKRNVLKPNEKVVP